MWRKLPDFRVEKMSRILSRLWLSWSFRSRFKGLSELSGDSSFEGLLELVSGDVHTSQWEILLKDSPVHPCLLLPVFVLEAGLPGSQCLWPSPSGKQKGKRGRSQWHAATFREERGPSFWKIHYVFFLPPLFFRDGEMTIKIRFALWGGGLGGREENRPKTLVFVGNATPIKFWKCKFYCRENLLLHRLLILSKNSCVLDARSRLKSANLS